ncbi:AMP-binding protein [Streptomyces sp. NPDC008092]|uniref:long-chain-fatty-acid--CoA ligase n=1 Tax=Streptomyces sp. NPDC008092 TaxID=3364808 RepID=UPI0036E91B85
MANLAEFLVETARTNPHRIALRLGEATISYSELDELSARAAAVLRAEGLVTGDRVVLMLPNVPEFVVLFYGILRAGGIVVPVNPLLKAREAAYHLQDSGASLIFEWCPPVGEGALGATQAGVRHVAVRPQEFAAMLEGHAGLADIAPADVNEVAVLLYTSGTTGRPKGAALTHGGLRHNIEATVTGVQQLTADDVIVGCLPLFHIFGQTCTMNAAVRAGAELILVPRFDARAVLEAAGRYGATVFQGVPTMYVSLLEHPSTADLSTLRLCVSGGASLPEEVLHGFERRFGAVVLEGYGMSETSPVISSNHPGQPRKAGSIGTPIAGVEVRLLNDEGGEVVPGEVGEIVVRSPGLMKGYWNQPQETAVAIPDGWLRTGDLAREDEDGYLYIVDRKKDMIIRGGYNVYPREIEELLHEHPAVALAAVIGVPHPRLGEEVAAFVVPRAGAQVEPEELLEFAKRRLAAYKYPRHVWLKDALPLGPSGKILKRQISVPDIVEHGA